VASKTKVENTQPKRDTVLFVRIEEVNKKFVDKEAKANNFVDTASYVNALITKLRTK